MRNGRQKGLIPLRKEAVDNVRADSDDEMEMRGCGWRISGRLSKQGSESDGVLKKLDFDASYVLFHKFRLLSYIIEVEKTPNLIFFFQTCQLQRWYL